MLVPPVPAAAMAAAAAPTTSSGPFASGTPGGRTGAPAQRQVLQVCCVLCVECSVCVSKVGKSAPEASCNWQHGGHTQEASVTRVFVLHGNFVFYGALRVCVCVCVCVCVRACVRNKRTAVRRLQCDWHMQGKDCVLCVEQCTKAL